MEEEKKMMRLKMRWREDGEKDKNSVLKKNKWFNCGEQVRKKKERK
jgi:hypothetical protein